MAAPYAQLSLKPPPPRMSGIKTVLRYTGIPPSWLDKRPKLPSRNWLIFLSVTSTIIGYGVYDRRECKRIRQEYVEKVQKLSEDPLHPLDVTRKVVVYGSKWPGDEEYQQAMKYFRKYVKPVLVAAAVDFEMITGKRLGDVAKRVAEDVRRRRRLEEGLDEESEPKKMLPTYKPPSEIYRRELEGGLVLIGRPTFKEFMAGLKKGWTNGLEQVDEQENMSRLLDEDHHFDEADEDLSAPAEIPSHSPVFTLSSQAASQQQRQASAFSESYAFPQHIPQLPPLLLVPFHNRIGFTQIPFMIWDWFNQRHCVQSGAEAGYRLVLNNTRPINVPEQVSSEFAGTDGEGGNSPSQSLDHGDLDFDLDKESLFKKSLFKIPEKNENARREYYEKLPARLATARALARNAREPTKEELENPPPTEVELRAERIKKELQWRYDLAGWAMVSPETPVAWDERFRDALRVFTDPSDN